MFVALGPDKKPLGLYPDMTAAQEGIAAAEPDVLKQSLYQIHPIRSPRDADALKLKIEITYCLEKFDGDYVGQAPIEVLTGEG